MGFEQAIVEQESPTRYRMTVREFLMLDEAGAFGGKRTELINGEVFILSPIYRPHARVELIVSVLLDAAVTSLGSALQVMTPVSAHLDDHNLPQPDVVVAAHEEGDFVSPGAARLAVEVSHTSLRHDLGTKAKLYARAGIPEYWVVDIKGRRIVQLWHPVEEAYQDRTERPFGEAIASATIAGLVVSTERLAREFG